MANTYKRLAALCPANTAEAQLYQPAADTSTICILNVCNQDTGAQTVRVALTDAAGAATGEDWLFYDYSIAANATFQLTGITLQNPETIRIKASVADKISFILFGLEVS